MAPLMFLHLLPGGVAGVEPGVATRTLLIIMVMKITTTTMAMTTMVTAADMKSPITPMMSSRGGPSVDQGADPEGDVGRGLHGAGLGFPSEEVQEEVWP